MKYNAISGEKATAVLEMLRGAREIDSDTVDVRGEGEELPKSVLDDLQKGLAKIRTSYPAVLGIRDPKGGQFEREACVVVHKAIPSDDPQMLADYDFWTWLAVEFRELVDWRHGGKEGVAHPANFGIGRREDNLFYRLWLRAEIGQTKKGRDAYELAQRGDQDFWRSHVFRQDYGKCRSLVHALLRLQFPGSGDKPRWNIESVRELAKRLRRVNATLIFESLDEDDAKSLVEREAAAVRVGS